MKSEQDRVQGLDVSPNPLDSRQAAGEKPQAEKQPWPGSERAMDPPVDHGETSYVGGNKLRGRKALITGGDSGIGRAVAIAFAREGADVAIAYVEEHDDAAETVRWIEEAGVKALKIPTDLSVQANCEAAVQQVVEAFGGIDLLVNNAAWQNPVDDVLALTPEQLERTFKTNFFAYVWVAQAALRHMPEGSAIVNTGSVQGLDPSPELLDYAATKAAIHSFTKSLAQAVADKGIRVNCVSPGPVWTPLIPATMPAEKVKSFGADTFWKRPAQPAELAPSYVFFASADSRYYTGELLAPTGRESTR